SRPAQGRARHLHGDDRHRRYRRRALQAQPRIPGRVIIRVAVPPGRHQDEYSLESQRRMAAAQQANKFKDEIVPMKTKMKVVDKATKAESIVDYVVDRDECNRPDTTMEGLAKLEPVRGPGKYITAGNA